MKSFIDLSSYSNQSRLSNTGKIIKQTSNNKSLNQTIEKKSKSKEKKIESKNLKKSNLNFNYSNQSKNKSYDLKKIKSNEILNLKINDKKIQKEKITQSYSNIKQKGGISIYRQKINKIIKDNKRGVKTVQNNNEIENCNNLLLFNCLNKNDLENGFNEFNNINSTINRYDTDSINQ